MTVVTAPDEFTFLVNNGTKQEEFQFDSVNRCLNALLGNRFLLLLNVDK
jgi:hypothetical protein